MDGTVEIKGGEIQVSPKEILDLAATDSIFFSRHFFPGTVRQEPPAFHTQMWQALENTARYLNLIVFRGGAKTTLLRLLIAKKASYGTSRTIMVVGKSQEHSIRTIRWIKKQVRSNHKWTSFYGLKMGDTWTDTEIQIVNETDGSAVWVLAFGITGSTRGLNLDDYRPDLIIVDDVVDEENSSTPEQRLKIRNLVLGSLKEALAPRSEAPTAKLVILQTPLDYDDVSQLAKKDPQFLTLEFSCWSQDSQYLPLEYRESAWPSRWSADELREERQAAQRRNTLSIFSREWEVRLVAPENAVFREEWLNYYTEVPPVHEMVCVLVIDPVPPPTPIQVKKGLHNLDFEALSVVGRWRNQYYVLETSYNRGHDPKWTVAEFFRLANKWRPRKVVVEAVAYQRTLAWLLREAMRKVGRYYVVEEFDDKRSKYTRIVDGLSGIASNGQLYINLDRHTEFLSQFIHYKEVKHEDVLETVAIGVTVLEKGSLPMESGTGAEEINEDHIPDLEYVRGAP